MIKYILGICTLLLVGCSTFEKQHFKARKFYNENRKELADLCSSEFRPSVEYIKGDSIVVRDTIVGKPIFVDCPDGSQKECPKNTHTKEVITVTDTIKIPDPALETKLRYSIMELEVNSKHLQSELVEVSKQSKNKDYIIVGLGLLVMGVFWFKKR